MTQPHKFLFDRSFDLPDPPRPVAHKVVAPPEPTFTKAEVEAARAAGFADGRAQAHDEAAQAIEVRIAAMLSSLTSGIGEALQSREHAAAEAQRRALETIRSIARKAVPALCRTAPLLELETVLGECLREAFDEPRIVLRVADGMFDAMQQRLASLTGAAGFAGKVVLLADESLDVADARIEWAEGGAERDTKRLLSDIDAALARALDTIEATGTTPHEENHDERSA
jgi:flagellar assembly protein FliH